jgi:hypothetical protein
MMALNDVWTLDVSSIGNGIEREGKERPKDFGMKWEEVETRGRKPSARGYHTANIVGHVMVVIGGSDGKECFSDVWCLNLSSSFPISSPFILLTVAPAFSYLSMEPNSCRSIPPPIIP